MTTEQQILETFLFWCAIRSIICAIGCMAGTLMLCIPKRMFRVKNWIAWPIIIVCIICAYSNVSGAFSAHGEAHKDSSYYPTTASDLYHRASSLNKEELMRENMKDR